MTARTNQALALIVGGLIALIPTIVGELTRGTIGIKDLITSPTPMSNPISINSDKITPSPTNKTGVRT